MLPVGILEKVISFWSKEKTQWQNTTKKVLLDQPFVQLLLSYDALFSISLIQFSWSEQVMTL